MILNRLEISGLGIIGERMVLTFPKEGKIGIFGNNETGKSTILESIPLALYGVRGNSKNKEDLITWNKEKCTIELEFEVNDQTFSIERQFSTTRHEAILSTITNGKKEVVEKNLKEIENQITQITGLDYNSFTKLVYIKQKELDSLRDLAKNDREQLINKIIGIEEFGNADKAIREDCNTEETKFAQLQRESEILTEKQERHKKLLEDEKQNTAQIDALERVLKQAEKIKFEAQAEFDKLNWCKDKLTQDQMLKSAQENFQNFEEAEQQIKEWDIGISQLTETTKKNEAFCEQNEAEFVQLTKTRDKLKQLNQQLETVNSEKIQLEKEIQASNTGHLQDLSIDIGKSKQKALQTAAVFALAAIVTVVLGIFMNQLFLLGALLLIPAFTHWKKYTEFETVSTTRQDDLTKGAMLKEKQEKIARLTTHTKETLANYKVNNPTEIDERLAKINEILTSDFDAKSFDSLRQTTKILGQEKGKKQQELDTLQKKIKKTPKTELSQIIHNHDKKIQELETKKPSGTDENEYSEQALTRVKKDLAKVEEKHAQIKNEFYATQKLLEKTKKDLESNEYKELPEKIKLNNTALTNAQQEIEILDLLRTTLKETSHELRAQVIPRAQMTIENLLPTLTDNRYFKLDIKEDFTFQAYTTDTNQTKPRDLFSGGTQDQFLIALRIAFAQSILTAKQNNENTTSLFMDECISSSDQARRKGIFAVLDALKTDFSQIFIIAHEDITENVDHALHLGRNQHGYTTVKQKSWQ